MLLWPILLVKGKSQTLTHEQSGKMVQIIAFRTQVQVIVPSHASYHRSTPYGLHQRDLLYGFQLPLGLVERPESFPGEVTPFYACTLTGPQRM